MDESLAAFIHKHVPQDKHVEWSQRGYKWALEEWKMERREDFQAIYNSEEFSVVLGYDIVAELVGDYGYDSYFRYYINTQGADEVIDDDDVLRLLDPFGRVWVRCMQSVIGDEISHLRLTPKEFAAWVARENPRVGERRAADGLDITVGTYRGKLGRVDVKIDQARKTAQYASTLESYDTDDWKERHTFDSSEPTEVIDASTFPLEYDPDDTRMTDVGLNVW